MIPKLIHYCWLSDDPFPPKIEQCVESWKRYLPDYEFKHWHTSNFDLEAHPWVKQAFEQKKYAFAADYIRLYALYNYGGIYLDSDVEVIKPFDDLLNLPYFACTEGNLTIEAGAWGAQKHLDWVGACLDYYKGRSFIKANGSPDLLPLPQIMMSVIRKSMLPKVVNIDTYMEKIDHYKDVGVFYMLPRDYFCAKDPATGELLLTENSYCIHNFAGSWVGAPSLELSVKTKIVKLICAIIGKSNFDKIYGKYKGR